MREFVSKEHFWLLRTRALISRDVQDRPCSHWKSTYYALEDCIEEDARHPIRRSEDKKHRTGRFTLSVIQDKIALLVLIEIGTVPNYAALDVAIEEGDRESTDNILRNLKRRREHSDQYSLTLAAERGYVDVFSFLLEEMKTHSDYTIPYEDVLLCAVMSGSTDMINRVLQEEGIDPKEDNCSALKSAIKLKHTKVASIILNDPRMDEVRHLYESDVRRLWEGPLWEDLPFEYPCLEEY